jgi:hypothetical protein
MPGYSGAVSNPMLAHALITTREALLAGRANVTDFKLDHEDQALPPMPTADKPGAIFRLQPGVRALLAGLELTDGLEFRLETDAAQSTDALRPCVLRATGSGNPIVRLASPRASVFAKQMKLVISHADLRAERQSEILSQVVPQSAGWAAIAGLSPEAHRYTWEILAVGLRFAMAMVMRFKLMHNVPRPVALWPLVQPMVLTPDYSAYPSGHATEAFFVAELLPMLMASALGSAKTHDPQAQHSLHRQLLRYAHRVAENRVVAGLHYPIDSIAGQVLGTMLARYAAARAGARVAAVGAAFPSLTTSALVSALDSVEPEADCGLEGQKFVAQPTGAVGGAQAPALVWKTLWERAAKEHRDPWTI